FLSINITVYSFHSTSHVYTISLKSSHSSHKFVSISGSSLLSPVFTSGICSLFPVFISGIC
ncbi:hypothetical protein IKI14_07290, partial [bacterium]|nr:hypothetical protein [bacterium]